MTTYIVLFFSLSFFLISVVLGAEYHIASADDFIGFASGVNSGNSYSGTTVYLDTDTDLSGKSLDVIGNDTTNYFQGTLDGQGHIISNLKINLKSQYVGLFGYSKGLTIKNVVIDDTCSVECSYSSSINNAYFGGILGYCDSTSSNCNIENTVNMGGVTFNGNLRSNMKLYFGGISGYLLSSSNYDSSVKNCANYGTVTHSGTSGSSYFGGIVGYSEGYSSSSNYIYIQNCLNYGTVTHKGQTSYFFYNGGIGGYTGFTKLENCVSGGVVTLSGTYSESSAEIGGIVGRIANTYITNCFWTSDVGYNKLYGRIASKSTIDDVTSQVTLNSAVMNKLNTYSSTNG